MREASLLLLPPPLTAAGIHAAAPRRTAAGAAPHRAHWHWQMPSPHVQRGVVRTSTALRAPHHVARTRDTPLHAGPYPHRSALSSAPHHHAYAHGTPPHPHPFRAIHPRVPQAPIPRAARMIGWLADSGSSTRSHGGGGGTPRRRKRRGKKSAGVRL
ncbi:hypothetical protein C8R47DRAFT_1222029 [Mycena vitilis]|nr:hypothetical protein C8R47DRAFT_1222029 [Mycena vitilis]